MGLYGASNGLPFSTGFCNGASGGGVGLPSRGAAGTIISSLGGTACAIASIAHNRGGEFPSPPFAADALRRRTTHGLKFATGQAVRTTRRLCRNMSVGNDNDINLVACVHASSLQVTARTLTSYEDCVSSTFNRSCVPSGPGFCGSGHDTRSTRRTVEPASVTFGPRGVGRSLGSSRCGLCGLV